MDEIGVKVQGFTPFENGLPARKRLHTSYTFAMRLLGHNE